MWVPDLTHSPHPAYLAVVEALAEAIRLGELRPGDQLPTHRTLADLVGVNVSTVTRAYKEAARRRLVGGEVGRGTYVLGTASEAAIFALRHRPEGGVIDLSTNRPPVGLREKDLASGLRALERGETGRYLHYACPPDILLHREAAAAWLRRRGLEADPEGIMVCAGAQHAMDTALGLFPQAEELGCEALVYPGLRAITRHRKLRLHALALDAGGVDPESLAAAARAGIRLAVLSPTLHNPTTATSDEARRRALVAVARRHDLTLIEEDVYGLLPEQAPPPLAALAPERVIYLTGLSKTVAPGLRLGYLHLPPRLRARIAEAEHHTTWYVSALAMALGTTWLQDGTAWRRLLAQRRELAARHRLCLHHLSGLDWRGTPACPHLWVRRPPGGAEGFTQRALAAGVVVVPTSIFRTGRGAEDGLRISIGSAADQSTLAEGLARLAALT